MFNPNYTITPSIAQYLIQIESLKEKVSHLSISSAVLKGLQESAKLKSTHFSTRIEGNRLTEEEVSLVLNTTEHIKDRERDEKEVVGYYEALEQVIAWSLESIDISEDHIKRIHALIMGDRRTKFSPYRDGQNVIREAGTGRIVYLPPEAKDVPHLMSNLVEWIQLSKIENIPDPIRAGILHYQFATIHPYNDGNGRTARLLTTLLLYLGGCDLQKIYSLEKYYVENISLYYAALNVGSSHNYYMCRETADITGWVEYFCRGMAHSFQSVHEKALNFVKTDEQLPHSKYHQKLYEKYSKGDIIDTKDLSRLFNVKSRGAQYIARKLVEINAVEVLDSSKTYRKYRVL